MAVAGEPTRHLLQQADLSAVGAIVNGLLNNNPTAAASAIAAAANSGNTAAITSAISFAGLAVSATSIKLSTSSKAVPMTKAQAQLEMFKALDF